MSLILRFDDGYYLNSKEAAIYFAQNPGNEVSDVVELEDFPLLQYSQKLMVLRDTLARQRELQLALLEKEKQISEKTKIYNGVYEQVLSKKRKDVRIDQLTKTNARDEEQLAKRVKMLAVVKENMKKKKEEMEFFSQTFAAYRQDLERTHKTLMQNKERLELSQKIYVARKIKVLFMVGYVFFNEQTQGVFKSIWRLKTLSALGEKSEGKIGNCLGYAVLLAMLLSKYINVSLPYPLVYNGPRSSIKKDRTEEFALYMVRGGDKPKLVRAIELLVQDYLQITSFCKITVVLQDVDAAEQLRLMLTCVADYLTNFFTK